MKNLSDFVKSHHNNLDSIRLLAALMVVFGHSWGFATGSILKVPFYSGIYSTYSIVGVEVFFIVSGFLITKSYLDNNNPGRFLIARCLRIFPALICVILITTFVIGPLVTTLPVKTYFSESQTYIYLLNIPLYVNVYLPGVFNGASVNEPLWTLQYEFGFYLIVLILGVVTLLKRRSIILGLFILTIILGYFKVGTTISLYIMTLNAAIWLFTFFSAGMVAYLYREHIPINPGMFFFVVGMLIIGSLKSGFDDSIFVFFLTYIVLFIAYSPMVKISFLTKYGDFSYGIYIWGFPLQRIILQFLGTPVNPFLMILISIIASCALGALSWHLIEKRMLKLKDKLPQKRKTMQLGHKPKLSSSTP